MRCIIMNYIDNNLHIKSDYDISTFKEWEFDKDLCVFLDKRCVNLNLNNLPKYILSRIQLPCVEKVLIRYCKSHSNNIATLHFLSDEGIHSTIMNFEMDYADFIIEIVNKEFFIDINVIEK